MRLHCIAFFVKPHTMKHVFACIILAVCLQAAQKPAGEKTIISSVPPVKNLYQKQIAQTIANLVGENFKSNKAIAPAVALK